MAASRSLYDVLGVAQNASADAVRKAYKIKALETHPDKLSPGALDIEKKAAEARFKEVRTAFEVLGDPAKRRAYDNGLDYLRRHVNLNDMQARIARERAEWARQAEARHKERKRVLREAILASQRRYRETMAQVELRYQERIRAMEEQLQRNREAELRAEQHIPTSYTLEDGTLNELRRMNPEWEVRRQEVLRRRAERLKREEMTQVAV